MPGLEEEPSRGTAMPPLPWAAPRKAFPYIKATLRAWIAHTMWLLTPLVISPLTKCLPSSSASRWVNNLAPVQQRRHQTS